MSRYKVLHCVGSLARGGIETWLTNLVRQQHPGLQMDFLVGSPTGMLGDYEAEVQALGSKVFHRPPMSQVRRRISALGLWPWPPTLRDLLIAGKYDVMHVHGEELNGDTVRDAARAGTPVRVAHCHSTMIARGKSGPEMLLRKLRYALLDRYWVMKYATDLIGCSRDAGRLMVGERWQSDSRCRVIYCGVPTRAIRAAAMATTRQQYLDRYGFPADALVVGHAGSMGPTPVKNHHFLLEVFAELARRDDRYRLVMAGGGPLRQSIEDRARELGIWEKVRMPGVIPDVPAHMARLFDVHLLPSRAEGLPVVAIEAAAVGLYTVMSDAITSEFDEVLPGRSERVSLQASVATWADRVVAAIGRRESVEEGLDRVASSSFGIEHSAESLYRVYAARLHRLNPGGGGEISGDSGRFARV